MTDDSLSEALDDIQVQAEDHHLVPGDDALRLVTAVREVLKLHPVNQYGMCRRCDVTAAISCPERRAISRALLGEESSDA